MNIFSHQSTSCRSVLRILAVLLVLELNVAQFTVGDVRLDPVTKVQSLEQCTQSNLYSPLQRLVDREHANFVAWTLPVLVDLRWTPCVAKVQRFLGSAACATLLKAGCLHRV